MAQDNPFREALYDAYHEGLNEDIIEPFDTTALDPYWAVIEAAKAQERRYAIYIEDGQEASRELYRSACVDTCHAVAALEAKEE